MKGYGTLLKLSVLNFLAGFRKGSWYKDNGKLNVSHIVTLAIVVLSFGWLAGFLLFAEIKLFDALVLIGQPMLLPSLTLFVAMALTLVFGLFTVLSALYFGKDTAWKAYLPVSSSAVLAVRWTEIYLGEMLVNLAIIGPSVVLYGIHIQGSVIYYLRALAVILATPLMPLVVTTLLSTLLVRVSGLSRHKESLVMIGSMLVVGVVVALEMTILPRIPEDADAMYFVKLLMGHEGLVNLLLGAFPPLLWAARGIEGQWMQWLMFMGLSFVVTAVLLLLIGPRYMTLCLQQSEQGTKRRKAVLRRDTWQIRTPLTALMQREWRELTRTPVYAFNAFSGIVMFPIMLVAMSLGISSASEGEMNLMVMLEEVLNLVAGTDLMLILTAVLAFVCFMNPAAATSISREGQRVSLSRMIPVKASVQLQAKLLVGLSINTMAQLVVIAILAFILRQYAFWLIPALLLATLFSYATTTISLTIDAIKPQFKWINETQAMKQNFNVMFSMLLNMVMLALPIVAVVLLNGSSSTLRCTVAAGILMLEAMIACLLMRFVAQRRYAELEG